MTDIKLERISPDDLPDVRRLAVDDEALDVARDIVDDVRADGADALRHHAERLGDLQAGEELFVAPDELAEAAEALSDDDRALIERVNDRILRFAAAQREAISEMETEIPGGKAGHDVAPVDRAGCYAPGGRYPLPSSVLMTVATARAAGVGEVWLASPKPTVETKAAAAIAGADGLLQVGGAQAIAAMTYGVDGLPACDAIVGPGNKWVTAAKQLVSGTVAIDMLAGPSELVILADKTANPQTIAADLLAQAEHDVEALPVVVCTPEVSLEGIEEELEGQLETLATAETARAALDNGFAVIVEDIEEGIAVCDRLAGEHLEVLVEDSEAVAERLNHYGGLFVGEGTAEVFGDYGAGPNHTLPTGGTARSVGGLSVATFLRIRTWMRIDDTAAAAGLARDSAKMARMESLEAHARSAELRDDE